MKKLLLSLALLATCLVGKSEAQGCFGPACGGGASGGGITSGAAATGCSAYSIVFVDSAGNLKCDPGAVVNGSVSTAGRSILTIRDVMSGSSATNNFFNVTGTLPATLSAEISSVLVSITGDNDAQAQAGIKSIFTPKSISGDAVAIFGSMLGDASVTNGIAVGGKFTAAVTSSAGSTLRGGLLGFVSTTVDSTKITGVTGVAYSGNQNSTSAAGVFGAASRVGGTPTSMVGVYGTTNTNATNYAGGYFELGVTASSDGNLSPTAISGTAAIVGNNGAIAGSIIEARDNGTLKWRIMDGGHPVFATTVPAVSNTSANSCGTTAATIAGTSETGIITVGATSGTSCTMTFPTAAPTRRQCTVTNETTANLSRATYSSTTVSIFAGTFVGGDVIAYICSVY